MTADKAEELALLTAFIGWLTGVALLPVIGIWALPQVVLFWFCVEVADWFIRGDQEWMEDVL